MRFKTIAIALGPPVLMFGVATLLKPDWLRAFSLPQVLAVGVVVGVVGAIAAHTVESRD